MKSTIVSNAIMVYMPTLYYKYDECSASEEKFLVVPGRYPDIDNPSRTTQLAGHIIIPSHSFSGRANRRKDSFYSW